MHVHPSVQITAFVAGGQEPAARGLCARLVVTDFTAESRYDLITATHWFPATQLALMHVLDIPYTSPWLDAAHGDELTRMEMATMPSFLAGAPLAANVRQQVIALVEHGHP